MKVTLQFNAAVVFAELCLQFTTRAELEKLPLATRFDYSRTREFTVVFPSMWIPFKILKLKPCKYIVGSEQPVSSLFKFRSFHDFNSRLQSSWKTLPWLIKKYICSFWKLLFWWKLQLSVKLFMKCSHVKIFDSSSVLVLSGVL